MKNRSSLLILALCLYCICTYGQAAPPVPDLTVNCTGAVLNLPTNAGLDTSNIVIGGTPVIASFSNFSNAILFPAVFPANLTCGIVPPPLNYYALGADTTNNIQSTLTIHFNKRVSNAKVYIIGMASPGENVTFTIKDGCHPVSPVINPVPGACNNQFIINANTGTITHANIHQNDAIVVNFGGVWFDEIAITKPTPPPGAPQWGGIALSFCIGATNNMPGPDSNSSTAFLSRCSNQLPATWNGITIPVGATSNPAYTTYTTTNTAGCDSTVTLDLTVSPSVTSTASLTLCTGQLPTTWNGIVIPAGATSNPAYTTYTTTNAAGCDSTVTLNLTVTPVVTSTVSLTRCTNQLPATWNGITIPVGATSNPAYTTYTTTNTAGCDSVVTLNLTVNPVVTSTAPLSLCSNQLPMLWNGIAIPAGTTSNPAFTTYTTTSAAGCDSIVSLNLTVNPASTSTASLSLCANQLPAVWNGITIPAGSASNPAYTTYTTTNTTGCDSTVTLDLTVSPSVTSTASLTLCTGQLPTTWNGIVIPAGATSNPAYTTYTTTNAAGCDSTVTLNLTVTPVVTSTVSLTRCTNQLPATWNGITIPVGATSNLAFTTYTTTSTVGCDSIVTLNLTVNPVVTSTAPLSLCSNQLPMLWNGIAIPAGTTSNPAFTTYTTTSAAGCDSIVSLNLTVNPASTSTASLSLCANQLPAVWNGITIPAGSASNPAYTTYTTTNATGCDSTVTLNLTINQPSAHIAFLTLCSDQLPVIWNGITIPVGTISNPAFTTYTTINTVGCDSTVTLNLTIKPTVTHDVDATICKGQEYTFGTQVLTTPGTYTHTFSAANACDSIVTLTLIVKELPLINIAQEGTNRYCLGDTITLTASGADQYLWSWKHNDFSLGGGTTKAVPIYVNNQIVAVEGTDGYGCQDTTEIVIKAEACCQLMMPNAFSPNGDGLNDGFGPETQGNPRGYAMHIYNRWGQMIYVSYKIEQKWDGTYNEQPAELGTYHYLITGECANGEQIKMKGDIILLR